MRYRQRPRNVIREDRAGKTINAVIGHTDHLIVGLEFEHSSHRAKYLLSDDLHVWLAVGKDRWLDEVPFLSMSATAMVQDRSVIFPTLDVLHHALEVGTIVQQTLLDLGLLQDERAPSFGFR